MDKKLLILGAGGHGQVVYEIATDCGYQQIDYLDDNSNLAIGKIGDMARFKETYEELIVGIGNNRVRKELMQKAREIGFKVATLIHPTAYISRSATIEEGVVIEPRAIVNAHTTIGLGSIVSVGAIVDHDVIVGECCHINTGAIVKAGAQIPGYQKLEAGEVVLGYASAIVNKTKEHI